MIPSTTTQPVPPLGYLTVSIVSITTLLPIVVLLKYTLLKPLIYSLMMPNSFKCQTSLFSSAEETNFDYALFLSLSQP